MHLMKNSCFYGLIIFLTTSSLIANPGSRIWNEFQQIQKQRQSFKNYSFLKQESQQRSNLFLDKAPKSSFWNLDLSELQNIQKEQPEFLLIDLKDYQQTEFQLLLIKQVIYSEDAKVITSDDPNKGEVLNQGIHYRGIIKAYPGSIVALSIFGDQIMAVLSTPDKGNIVFGKMNAESLHAEQDLPHVLYYENDLPVNSGFQCGTSDVHPTDIEAVSLVAPDTIFSNHCKTIKVFLECDYRLYTDRNSQKNQVTTYISGLFNVVKTLYYNEFVNIEISEIMVWTTQDPFLHTDLQSIIFNYTNYRKNNFNGNLAQLVTTYPPQQQGGIAWLATLCQPYNGQSGPHSFAYIYNSYSSLPTYSWSVEVMAHEMGHNMGSPHTHACYWGPNRNTALDNCQPPENNACSVGPPATGGGTIMSYCHLTGYGINFSKGFGDEPGDLIRASVESKSCLSARYTPIIVPNIVGPYFEGDTITLKARPGKSSYDFDWFHYDYLMPSPKDSILKPLYSGIYKVAISDRCTEYSIPDTVHISDFFVNLGCPVIPGKRDSFVVSLTMNADQGSLRDSVQIPDSLFQNIPAGVRDVLIELQTKIAPQGSSWTRDVITAYQSPANIGILNSRYVPNAAEPALFNGVKTYKRILGRFNPKGTWYFTTNDNKFDNGVDAKVTFSIVLSWREKDSVAVCDIPLCNGVPRNFDAAIKNAKYKWSTGDTAQTISVQSTGPLSVEVSRGNKKTSHTIKLYNYITNYQQQFTICDGDTLKVGKKNYTKQGIYKDTLKSFNACDSILETTVAILQKKKTYVDTFICFADTFRGMSFIKDTILNFPYLSADGCDSNYIVNLKVNPPFVILANSIAACPEIGGSLEVLVSGGSGSNYQYEWSHGERASFIDSLQAGIYTIKVVDSSGCFVQQEVELKNLDSVGFLSLVTDVSCFGKNDGRISIDFISGVSPFNISWNNGATTQELLNLPTGKYTIFVRDAQGCQSQREISIGSPELLFVNLDLTGSTGNDGTAKATITGGIKPYIYLWSTGETDAEIKNLKPGDYWLSIMDENGCEVLSQFTIQQIIATTKLDIGKAIKFYPNPVNDQLFIEFNNSGKDPFIAFQILDVYARPLQKGNLKEGINVIEVGNLHTGVYILEFRLASGLIRKTFVKV
ncbi:MAG: hypothetical protein IPL31_13470 [Saprospiraceae bacterium]|nr:hypothetical protein [Saprospiraceae bacterium]